MVNIFLLHSQLSYLGPNRIENILLILHWHHLLCNLDFKHECPPCSIDFQPCSLQPFSSSPDRSCSVIGAASAVSDSWLPLTYWITSWLYVMPVNFSSPESTDEHFNQFLHSSKLKCWKEFCKIVVFAAFKIQLFFCHLCPFPLALLCKLPALTLIDFILLSFSFFL